MTSQTKKSILWGIIGGLLLLELYFLILTLASSLDHALEQFKALWPWMSGLIIGFSIQVGLYSYIRQIIDVMPILGLSAAFLFLAQYQEDYP